MEKYSSNIVNFIVLTTKENLQSLAQIRHFSNLKVSLLPETKLPSMLLWSPIEKAFLLETPKINHNFFGIHDRIKPRIIASREEQKTVAVLASININTKETIKNSASYRLKDITYTIIDTHKILIIGTPLLPIQGESYWLDNNFLFPNGFNLEYPILSASIQKQLNPLDLYYVLWNKNGSYSLILKTDCLPLSISSFRLSLSAPK